ncbi:MAG TPA: hypothetical protein GX708_23390 [Gallicola sp.]|nr:hypothetical protein [Gallicola sp.]
MACQECKYFYEDYSVGIAECENDQITEEELSIYFSDNKDGCPHKTQ